MSKELIEKTFSILEILEQDLSVPQLLEDEERKLKSLKELSKLQSNSKEFQMLLENLMYLHVTNLVQNHRLMRELMDLRAKVEAIDHDMDRYNTGQEARAVRMSMKKFREEIQAKLELLHD